MFCLFFFNQSHLESKLNSKTHSCKLIIPLFLGLLLTISKFTFTLLTTSSRLSGVAEYPLIYLFCFQMFIVLNTRVFRIKLNILNVSLREFNNISLDCVCYHLAGISSQSCNTQFSESYHIYHMTVSMWEDNNAICGIDRHLWRLNIKDISLSWLDRY